MVVVVFQLPAVLRDAALWKKNWQVLRSSWWGLELLCSMLVTERCTPILAGQSDGIRGCGFRSREAVCF